MSVPLLPLNPLGENSPHPWFTPILVNRFQVSIVATMGTFWYVSERQVFSFKYNSLKKTESSGEAIDFYEGGV